MIGQMIKPAISILPVSSDRPSMFQLELVIILVQVSDQTVKLGDLPIDTIMSNLTSLCSDSGLCETDSLVLTGYKFFIGGYGDSGKDEIVTIQASGSYPTMLHDNLLEALGAAVNAVANCSVVNGIYPCYGSATAYCPGEPV